MIDRIGNGNTYTPPYDRGGKKAARVDGDAPAFLLPGEENGGVIWERSPKEDVLKSSVKKEDKEENKEKYKVFDVPETDEEDEPEYKQSGFGKLIGRIGEAIKRFFARLWYGDDKRPEEKGSSDGETGSFADAAGKAEEINVSSGTEEGADRERRIRSLIAEKDEEGLMDELTEGGKKHPARNTSLLTHYDRRGRLVKPDDSQTGRILSDESRKSGRNVERRPQGNYRRYI